MFATAGQDRTRFLRNPPAFAQSPGAAFMTCAAMPEDAARLIFRPWPRVGQAGLDRPGRCHGGYRGRDPQPRETPGQGQRTCGCDPRRRVKDDLGPAPCSQVPALPIRGLATDEDTNGDVKTVLAGTGSTPAWTSRRSTSADHIATFFPAPTHKMAALAKAANSWPSRGPMVPCRSPRLETRAIAPVAEVCGWSLDAP
jgi:hypothetical protein